MEAMQLACFSAGVNAPHMTRKWATPSGADVGLGEIVPHMRLT